MSKKKDSPITLSRTEYKNWKCVSRWHYLSKDLLQSAYCYWIYAGEKKIGFLALLHNHSRYDLRISRIVLFPQYQGQGYVPKIFAALDQFAKENSYKITIAARHPAIMGVAVKMNLPLKLYCNGMASVKIADYTQKDPTFRSRR